MTVAHAIFHEPVSRLLPVVHVRKEFRDHRTTVIALFAMVLGFGILLSVIRDPYWVETKLTSSLTFGAAFCAAILLGPVLAEHRPGTRTFLERLPTSANVVFFSKMAFLVLVVTTTAFLGYVISGCLGAKNRELGFDLILLGPGPTLWIMFSTLLAGTFWSFAASLWLPRGLLAPPMAVLVMLAMALPGWAVLPDWFSDRAFAYIYQDLPARTILCLHPPIALLAAWWSFVGGRQRSRGALSAAWRGLSVAALGAGGLTTVALALLHDIQSPDVEDLEFESAIVGPNGKFAFATADSRGHGWPRTLLVIDLLSNTARRLPATSYFRRLGQSYRAFFTKSAPELITVDAGPPDPGWLQVLDSNTAEVLDEHHANHSPGKLAEECRASFRRTSSLHLPDSRRAWTFAGELLIDVPGTSIPRVLLDKDSLKRMGHYWPRGFGIVGPGMNNHDYTRFSEAFDILRERRFEPPEGWSPAACLSEGWILSSHKTSQLCLFDPTTREFKDLPGCTKADRFVHVDSQGDLLVKPEGDFKRGEADRIYRVDVARGTRQPITFASVKADFDHVHLAGTLADGRKVFQIFWAMPNDRFGRSAVTTLAPGGAALTDPIDAKSFGGHLGGTVILVITPQGKLEAVDLATGSRELLAPRILADN